MPIRVVCPGCGKVLQAPAAAAGKRGRCTACQAAFTVPLPAPPEVEAQEYKLADEPPPTPKPVDRPAASHTTIARPTQSRLPDPISPPNAGLRRTDSPLQAASTFKTTASVAPYHWARNYVYLLFALALVPLAWSLMTPSDDVAARFERTIEANPEAFEAPLPEGAEPDLDFVLERLPGGGVEGAHLSRSTWVHWLYGLLSATAFLGVIIVAFERGQAKPSTIAMVGLLTATGGILFLLSVQFIAELTQVVWLRGGGIVMIIFYVLKLIGFSYNAAMDPENGFLLSFFGFTVGVGLCEEFTKALPVIVRSRDDRDYSWRAATMWGLASGVGFGVAEGIMYSSQYYNGIHGGGMYLIRFVSCVALHAVWAAAVALLIWNNQEKFLAETDWFEFASAVLIVQGVPMVLHGLYDTMLKKEMNLAALATAVLSFAWLAFLVEYTRRQQEAD